MVRALLRQPSVRVATVLLVAILFLGLFGPHLAPQSPLAGSDELLQHPSAHHLLGTDYLGRDVLSRLLYGSPVSVFGALLVAFIALCVGVVPGMLSVYLGSTFEWLSLRFFDALIALPFLLFAVSMTALLGNGVTQAMVAVGILLSPGSYRVSRAAALSVARSQYVEAALLSGATTFWILRKHVWSKVLPPISIALAAATGHGLVVVSSLTFLGIGVRPPEPSWGGLLASDLGYLNYRPYAPVFPTFLILIAVWSLNALADGIRDVTGQSSAAPVRGEAGLSIPARPASTARDASAA